MSARDDYPAMTMQSRGQPIVGLAAECSRALDEIDRLRANQRPQLRLANPILVFTRHGGEQITATAICSECAHRRDAALDTAEKVAENDPLWDHIKRMSEATDRSLRCNSCNRQGLW
jgi:hypothetical protein